jgi:hypothetical protein
MDKNNVDEIVLDKVLTEFWKKCEEYDRLDLNVDSNITVNVKLYRRSPPTSGNDLTEKLIINVVKQILEKFENDPEEVEYRGNREEGVLMLYDCELSERIKTMPLGEYTTTYSANVYVGYIKLI